MTKAELRAECTDLADQLQIAKAQSRGLLRMLTTVSDVNRG